MSKDTFWALIQEAKTACGQDMDAITEHLRDGLLIMGTGAARQFHNIFQAYMDLAEPFGLWDAASIIKENGCTLEGFIDFRAWLIAQGKAVYLNALRDPDTLADVEPYGDCSFESIAYVGNDVYHNLTGQDAYGDLDTAGYLKLRDELQSEVVCQGFAPNTAAQSDSMWIPVSGIFPCTVSAFRWSGQSISGRNRRKVVTPDKRFHHHRRGPRLRGHENCPRFLPLGAGGL